MKTDFLEKFFCVVGQTNAMIAACEDIYNGNIAGDVVSLAEADGAVFLIAQLANAGGNATIQIYACDDTTPTTTVPIAFNYREIDSPDTQGNVTAATSAGFVTSTGANVLYAIEVDAKELASLGYEYIQFIATEDTNAAVDGCVIGPILTGLRYKEDVGATQVT